MLSPWLDYWRLSLRLEDSADARTCAHSSTRTPDTYVAERLRGDWLKVLGKRGDWQEFERELALYAREDLEIRCYALALAPRARRRRRARRSDGDLARAARAAGRLRSARPTLWSRGRVSITDVWHRVRVLFENGQITAAKTALGYLPKPKRPTSALLAEAARQPKRLLASPAEERWSAAPRARWRVLAACATRATSPRPRPRCWQGRSAKRLPEPRTRITCGAASPTRRARLHHESALDWYARAGDAAARRRAARLEGARRAARAALAGGARGDRPHVGRGAQDPAWTYWYGRALAAQGEDDRQPRLLPAHRRPADFYGLLATEELGYVAALPEPIHVPTEPEVAAAAAIPGLARALELIRLGLRTEGVREWLFTIRYFDDQQLLAAAELARRAGIYDRAINTADRTAHSHNFALRYPLPFHDVFREYAKTHGLDEAWVLGLVRQESRFIADARSSAGAAGLMQLMPRTARCVAAKIGMRNYRPKNVTEVQTNIDARHRLPEDGARPARPPGARLGRLQRRARARAPLARREAARRRDLRRDHPASTRRATT